MKIDSIERHLFFEGILLRYGYDFRQYASASLDRRLTFLLTQRRTASLIDLLKEALASPEAFRKMLPSLTINTTQFFRDPAFFKSLRESVFPMLRTHSRLSIWSAGCSTGEEVLSLAIALSEEGLSERSTIYATDINPAVLAAAKEAIYDVKVIADFNKSYVAAGGTASPSEYYTTEYGLVRFDRKLLANISFLEHNLVTDDVFVEAHLILCRNVLIYFSKPLQDRVLGLFARSLAYKGFLGIGPKEAVQFSSAAKFFERLSGGQNIFVQKVHAISGEKL